MVIHNDTDNKKDTNSSFQNKWYSRGFPSNTAWGWNKAAPKNLSTILVWLTLPTIVC